MQVVGKRLGAWRIQKRIGSTRGAHRYLGLLWVCKHDNGQVRVFDSATLQALDSSVQLPVAEDQPRRVLHVKSIPKENAA